MQINFESLHISRLVYLLIGFEQMLFFLNPSIQSTNRYALQLSLYSDNYNYNQSYNQVMSVSKKDFYFLTNNSTMFRYFVDNSTGKAQHYLFYPQKYETMTAKQIKKYEHGLIWKMLWWSVTNKEKMVAYDYQICKSRAIDAALISIGTLLLARYLRKFLFRQEFIFIEGEMQRRNIDVRFWKALTAYSISLYMGWRQIKSTLVQTYLSDLAIEYSPNFIPRDELKMKQIEPIIQKYYQSRFPWLNQSTNEIKQ